MLGEYEEFNSNGVTQATATSQLGHRKSPQVPTRSPLARQPVKLKQVSNQLWLLQALLAYKLQFNCSSQSQYNSCLVANMCFHGSHVLLSGSCFTVNIAKQSCNNIGTYVLSPLA